MNTEKIDSVALTAFELSDALLGAAMTACECRGLEPEATIALVVITFEASARALKDATDFDEEAAALFEETTARTVAMIKEAADV